MKLISKAEDKRALSLQTRFRVILLLFLAVSVTAASVWYMTRAVPAPTIGGVDEPGSKVKTCDYLVYPDGSTYLASNCSTGANQFSSTSFAGLFNSLSGLVFIQGGTFTPTATLNLAASEKVIMDSDTIVDGSALSANVFSAVSISNFEIRGGQIKSKAGFAAVDVNGGTDFRIFPDMVSGGGAGVYIHGSSSRCSVGVYAKNLGQGGSNGRDGVPIYTDYTTSYCDFPFLVHWGDATGAGNVNAWAGGQFSGTDINVGRVVVYNSAGGGARVGDLNANPKSQRITVGQVIMDIGNTNGLFLMNAENVTVGQVIVARAGCFSACIGEAGVQVFGKVANFEIGTIVSVNNGGEGVLVTTGVGSNKHGYLGSVIARNNDQSGSSHAGLTFQANLNGASIQNVTVTSYNGYDSQTAKTQDWAIRWEVANSATLQYVWINDFYRSGQTTPVSYGIGAGTFSHIYQGEDSWVWIGTSVVTGGTTVSLPFSEPDTSYMVLIAPSGTTTFTVSKTTTSFTVTPSVNATIDITVRRQR